MSKHVQVALRQGPLSTLATISPRDGIGAWFVFEGIVRPTEGGKPLAALCYEAYEPMTSRELTRLAEATATEQRLLQIAVEHSVGRVAVGEVSFRLAVGSEHRAEAIAATDRFIAQMKQIVPLWKVPEHADQPDG